MLLKCLNLSKPSKKNTDSCIFWGVNFRRNSQLQWIKFGTSHCGFAPSCSQSHLTFKSIMAASKAPWPFETVHLAKNEDRYPFNLIPHPLTVAFLKLFWWSLNPKKMEAHPGGWRASWGGGRSNGFSNNRMETSKLFWDMDVSKNRGFPPKWMRYNL